MVLSYVGDMSSHKNEDDPLASGSPSCVVLDFAYFFLAVPSTFFPLVLAPFGIACLVDRVAFFVAALDYATFFAVFLFSVFVSAIV